MATSIKTITVEAINYKPVLFVTTKQDADLCYSLTFTELAQLVQQGGRLLKEYGRLNFTWDVVIK
jgi:hypothetical protein